jgi:hypothetical protein
MLDANTSAAASTPRPNLLGKFCDQVWRVGQGPELLKEAERLYEHPVFDDLSPLNAMNGDHANADGPIRGRDSRP